MKISKLIMNNSGRCAACKYLRRRCPSDCIFSPYFPSNNPERFACVHRIYGASNVGKMLQKVPTHLRAEAADNLYFEAKCRIQDPVYGCVGIISQLHQQIRNTQSEVEKIGAEIASLIVNSDAQHELAQPHHQYHHNNIEMEAYLNTFFSGQTNVDGLQSQTQAP